MDAYIYQADLVCPECAKKIMAQLDAEGGRPRDPDDEHTYDSDDYPKGPYADGGGESDGPQNCGNCHVWLENPLTSHGVEQVLEMADDEIARGPEEYNRIMPAKGTGEDTENFSRWHGQPHKAIVLEWLEDLTNYGLSGEQADRLDRALAILRDGVSPEDYEAGRREDEGGDEAVGEAANRLVDRLLEGGDDRRAQILKHVDDHFSWPADATAAERAELIHDGFASGHAV